MVEATTADIMAVAMSHHLRDGDVAIMGAYSMIPMAACRLAQLTHAPNLSYIAGGSGAVNPRLAPLTASSCDSRLLRAESVLSLPHVIDFEAKTRIDVFFAGGLQVDGFGNCNLVCVGDWRTPKLRGPGTVGLSFLSRAKRFVIYTHSHSKRQFVEKVDYLSGPGFIEGSEGRTLPGGGPSLVVTPLCVMDFDERKRVRLKSLHPGVTLEQVLENTGFELIIPDEVPQSERPTAEELEMLLEIDPEGVARNSIR